MQGCSFTGHRVIKGTHETKLADLIARAINYAYGRGCRDFYSGGAIGFDTYAAREVLRFRASHPDVRLVMLLPCVDQDARWSYAQRREYRRMLGDADEISYVSEKYTDTCIKERNYRLVRECDILIAYMSNERSGTGQTVSMAKKLGREIYNLYPTLERE